MDFNKSTQSAGGHIIDIGGKRYRYNGSGDTADLKNYTAVNPVSLPPGATLVSGEVPMRLPPGASLVSGNPTVPPATPQAPESDSFWSMDYRGTVGDKLQRMAGELSSWAQQKANQKGTEELGRVAQGAAPSSFASETFSPRAGYDLLAHTADLSPAF